MDVLLERRRAGSRPGSRTDPHRVALAIEGGGMRGIVSGAMMVALNDMGLTAGLDAVYAFSAGALNGAYFVTGASWEALACYYDHLIEPGFFDPRRVLRREPVMSLDFVIDEIMERRNPLDFQAVLDAGLKLHVTVSSIPDIKARTISEFASKEDLKTVLRATACLPVVGGPPVPYHGDLLLDGGVLLSHPVLTAIEDGASHIVVFRTKPEGSRRDDVGPVEQYAARRLEKMRSGLGKAFLEAQRDQERVQAILDPATPPAPGQAYQLLDVVCPAGSHKVGRFTRDRGILFDGIRAGYGAMVRCVEGRAADVYLRPVLREPPWLPAQRPGDEPRATPTTV
ncbi:hypothetical protein BCD49_20340 [Pseudofrankia sp. EUN1h]|nr:hypothetical protein BCD49_20340 [Pseudofrankia sp. EUN1h]